jgi:ABC-type glycerol-3-phosphate transport system permease component
MTVLQGARARRRRVGLAKTIVLGVLVLLTYYPLFFTVQTSFKSNAQFYTAFWAPTWPLHLGNYTQATSAIAPYILNSVIVTGAATFGVVAVASLAAYAFSRLDFPGRQALYYSVIALMMVPAALTIVPLFVMIKNIGLIDTRWALIIPYIAVGQVLGIFVMRAFFDGVEPAYFDAARVDGASELRIFWSVALPLVRPVMVVVGILEMITAWNDYVWPFLVLTNNSLKTLVVGLVSFEGVHSTQWGPLMAGYTVASLPLLIVFFFTMRYFISGLSQGGLKA